MLGRVWSRGKEPSYTVGGNVSWYSHYAEQQGASSKTKNRVIIWPRNPTPGSIFETLIQRHTYTPMFTAAVFTIAKTRVCAC